VRYDVTRVSGSAAHTWSGLPADDDIPDGGANDEVVTLPQMAHR